MSDHPETDQEQTFLEHLVELRSRLLKACGAVLLVLLCLLPFSRHLYEWLAGPLLAQMPEGSSMIAIDVASPFLTPFKLTLLLSVMISIPVVLYQLWAFVGAGWSANAVQVFHDSQFVLRGCEPFLHDQAKQIDLALGCLKIQLCDRDLKIRDNCIRSQCVDRVDAQFGNFEFPQCVNIARR